MARPTSIYLCGVVRWDQRHASTRGRYLPREVSRPGPSCESNGREEVHGAIPRINSQEASQIHGFWPGTTLNQVPGTAVLYEPADRVH